VKRTAIDIAACRDPEELAGTLADEVGDFLDFNHRICLETFCKKKLTSRGMSSLRSRNGGI
jgi:hypothetical protein